MAILISTFFSGFEQIPQESRYQIAKEEVKEALTQHGEITEEALFTLIKNNSSIQISLKQLSHYTVKRNIEINAIQRLVFNILFNVKFPTYQTAVKESDFYDIFKKCIRSSHSLYLFTDLLKRTSIEKNSCLEQKIVVRLFKQEYRPKMRQIFLDKITNKKELLLSKYNKKTFAVHLFKKLPEEAINFLWPYIDKDVARKILLQIAAAKEARSPNVIIKKILTAHPEFIEIRKKKDNNTLFHYRAMVWDLNFFQFCFSKYPKASQNLLFSHNDDQETPLHTLFSRDIGVNRQSRCAIMQMFLETAKTEKLLSKKNREGKNVLHLIFYLGGTVDEQQCLLKKCSAILGKLLNMRDVNGKLPLEYNREFHDINYSPEILQFKQLAKLAKEGQ